MTARDKRLLSISVVIGLFAAAFLWGILSVVQNANWLRAAGIGGQQRYLVLAQNPAELRPAGGYTGTVGVIGVSNGRLTEKSFKDVYYYDLKQGVPFVEPPEELANHLLGSASWQLADAAWSPDFPTSAQNALRLYTLESGDADIDGVIALTTFAVDRLLEVTGPITVPEYGVTVASGDVTMTALALTRGVSTPTSDRKAFLDVLANETLNRIMSLFPTEWPRLAEALSEMRDAREVLVWFKDPTLQAAIGSTPAGGAVFQGAGDYVGVVESNLAPTSKYNLVIQRTDALNVVIDAAGNTTSDLTMQWQNDSMLPGEPYASLREYSKSKVGQYGAFIRLLTPASSKFSAVQSQAITQVDEPEIVATEVGRNVFGSYLLMGPGQSALQFDWTASGIATQSGGVWTYRLTLQKQPGVPDAPITVTIALPDGATVQSVTPGVRFELQTVRFAAQMDTDVQLEVTYRLP